MTDPFQALALVALASALVLLVIAALRRMGPLGETSVEGEGRWQQFAVIARTTGILGAFALIFMLYLAGIYILTR